MMPFSVWSGTYSSSARPRMMLVRSKMNRSWLRGMPIMSTMIRSGSVAATSVTKSPSPRSITSSTIAAAVASTSPFMRSSCLGVKPRETMRRMRACLGSSMLIIEPRNSRNSVGMSGMLVPDPEQKTAGCFDASSTSAWRVSE